MTLPESLFNRVQLHLHLPVSLSPVVLADNNLRRTAVDRGRRQTLIECSQVLLRLTHLQVCLGHHRSACLQQGRALPPLVDFLDVGLVGRVIRLHEGLLLVVKDLVSLNLLHLKLLLAVTALIVHSLLVLLHMLSIFSKFAPIMLISFFIASER